MVLPKPFLSLNNCVNLIRFTFWIFRVHLRKLMGEFCWRICETSTGVLENLLENLVKFTCNWNFIFSIVAGSSLFNDDDELFYWYGWPVKGFWPHFQPGPLSEVLTIANFWHSSTCTRAEPDFRLHWIKLCSSDNYYTTVPQRVKYR